MLVANAQPLAQQGQSVFHLRGYRQAACHKIVGNIRLSSQNRQMRCLPKSLLHNHTVLFLLYLYYYHIPPFWGLCQAFLNFFEKNKKIMRIINPHQIYYPYRGVCNLSQRSSYSAHRQFFFVLTMPSHRCLHFFSNQTVSLSLQLLISRA